MRIKRKIAEYILGNSLENEYIAAAKESFLCVEDVYEKKLSFPSVEDIIRFHVSSEHPIANVFKVKTRMLLTIKFITDCVTLNLDDDSFLDVGGSSAIFMNLLGVKKENGCVVNVDKKQVEGVKQSGYSAVLVKNESIPFEDNSFDYCLSMECLEHTLNPYSHLKELQRIAKKGIFVTIPFRQATSVIALKKGSSAFDQHVIEFSVTDYQRLLQHCGLTEMCFKILRLEAQGNSWIRRQIRKKMGWAKPAIYLSYLNV